jgi:hypothetical protein
LIRLAIPGLAVAACTACFFSTDTEPPPFPQTAFQDLEQVLSVSTSGTLAVGEGERTLYVGIPGGGVATWDITGGGLTFVASKGAATVFPIFERGVLLVPLPEEGVQAWTTDDDGRTWQVLGTSPFPAIRARLSGDAALLSGSFSVTVVDAAALLAGNATEADVRARVDVPALAAGDAVLVDDVLFVGTTDGALTYDLAVPTNPVLIGRVGDWFADRLLLYGDLLLVQSGYDTTVADVSDPRDPRVVAHLVGGLDMAVRDDWLYALDRKALYITNLRGDPEQVRQVVLEQECQSVAATADAVFAICAGGLRRLEPNSP